MVQVFAPLRSAQSIRPPDELRPIFRFLPFSNSPFLFRNSFFIPTYSLNPWFRSSLRYGRRRASVHRTNLAPSSASLPFMPFFYLQDTIQFHLLRSPWRSTERLRTSKLPLCYHFSKTQQEIFPHHTAKIYKSLRFPVYRLFYSFYNIEVTRS